jgi:hypothetical protein
MTTMQKIKEIEDEVRQRFASFPVAFAVVTQAKYHTWCCADGQDAEEQGNVRASGHAQGVPSGQM